MAKLVIPNALQPLTKCAHCGNTALINEVWFQKFQLWLEKTNQDSLSTTNGRLTVVATSDTNLRFSYRGSDDITRTADLTLS